MTLSTIFLGSLIWLGYGIATSDPVGLLVGTISLMLSLDIVRLRRAQKRDAKLRGGHRAE